MQQLMLSIFIVCTAIFTVTAQSAEETSYRKVKNKEIRQIIEAVETHICNPAWVESPEWKQFTAEIQSEDMRQLPLNEFQQHFNMKCKALPFTHLYLKLIGDQGAGASTTTEPAPFELKSLNETTALLDIRSFVADAPGMIKLVQQIDAGGYENLIIDLRENTGGSLDAAVVLGRFLTNEPIDAGVYLTRKWFMNHEGYPSGEDIQQFPFLQDMTFEGITKAYAENEAFRMVLPPHSDPTFQGKVFVLTSNITASTCEPLVDLLKKKDLATIVGYKTNGAMLSGQYFKINKDLKLFLPISDYITAEGTRIDQVGIEPHISVNPQKALEYVLDELLQDQR